MRPHLRWGLRAAALLLPALALAGCSRPYLSNDGTLVFQEEGVHGAAVLTAHGVEYRDRDDLPLRAVHHDPYEPWVSPVGFIVPVSGVFTQTSRPTVLSSPGLAVAIRPSDTRVPSWGGEILARLDVIAPAAVGTARRGERIAVVLDGEPGDDTVAFAREIVGGLASRDRVVVYDARTGGRLVPLMPAAHRSMVDAAIVQSFGHTARQSGGLAKALEGAAASLTGGVSQEDARVVVLTAGAGEPGDVGPARARLAAMHAKVSLIPTGDAVTATSLGTRGGDGSAPPPNTHDARLAALHEAAPPAGAPAFEDVVLRFDATPSPMNIVEASGGEIAWQLDAGELRLGELRAGEARTEVVRLLVPSWTPGETFTFRVTATATDANTKAPRVFGAEMQAVYDDDIERIAASRNGDVIAYASAMATLSRLDAAFAGGRVAKGDKTGGLRRLALLQARSLSRLAKDTGDAAVVEQAEMLEALVSATR